MQPVLSVPDNARFLRTILDAIPSFILIVDRDVCVQECNAAAARLLDREQMEILKRRGGELLDCLHSHDAPGGCGQGPHCKLCVVRNSVGEALAGSVTIQRRVRMELLKDQETSEFYALVTATPLPFDGQTLVLLVIENINELVELRGVIPICAKCRKVRDDSEYWTSVEGYLKRHYDMDFSHGLCPVCYADAMAHLDAEIAAEEAAKAQRASGGG